MLLQYNSEGWVLGQLNKIINAKPGFNRRMRIYMFFMFFNLIITSKYHTRMRVISESSSYTEWFAINRIKINKSVYESMTIFQLGSS